ncbi:MAG: hypothetical protein ACM3JQ_03745 [Candidatus Eiseniibacteriota bacterium]
MVFAKLFLHPISRHKASISSSCTLPVYESERVRPKGRKEGKLPAYVIIELGLSKPQVGFGPTT